MTLEFVDAEPVAISRGGAGRKAQPNPFAEVVAAIALKTNPATGKPVAKAVPIPTGTDDEVKKTVARMKAQVSKAGLLCNPQVSTYSIPNDDLTVLTFWTVPKINKPRKAAE